MNAQIQRVVQRATASDLVASLSAVCDALEEAERALQNLAECQCNSRQFDALGDAGLLDTALVTLLAERRKQASVLHNHYLPEDDYDAAEPRGRFARMFAGHRQYPHGDAA